MPSPEGGFHSTQDADSEGEEGKFFVWTPDEADVLLGSEDGSLFRAYFDVTEAGNFEHRSILGFIIEGLLELYQTTFDGSGLCPPKTWRRR